MNNHAAEPLILGESLRRSFGEGETLTHAVRDVSLEVRRGEFVLIMGPSGCGKSTLLAALGGLLAPDEGRVLVAGRDLWSLSDYQRRQLRNEHFGFVFQGYNLFPTLTACENLEVVLRWGSGTSAAEARRLSLGLLGHLHMTHRAGLLPAQLSGGEKQRVAVARALVKQPAVLFADEPTAALDWEHGSRIIDLLRQEAHERGMAILMVTHDPRITGSADRVLRMDDGRLTSSSS